MCDNNEEDECNSVIDVEREIRNDEQNTVYSIQHTLSIEEPRWYQELILIPYIEKVLTSQVELELLISHIPFFSTCFFMVPIIWVAVLYNYVPLPPLLITVSVLATFVSFFFWFHPHTFRNGWIHKMDAFMARVTIVIFVLYNMITGGNTGFWMSCFTMFVFFYLSNHFSTIEWCSCLHILSHVCAHIYAGLGIFFTIKHALDRKEQECFANNL